MIQKNDDDGVMWKIELCKIKRGDTGEEDGGDTAVLDDDEVTCAL